MKRVIIRDKVLVQGKDGSSVSLTARQYKELRERRSEGHNEELKGAQLILAPEGGIYILLRGEKGKARRRIGPLQSGWE
ncbi:MAG: hypothetical protein AAB497_02550 [Patescibacteria group bacterium]